jgi:choline dehydrogenase-like flavoprotein
MRIAVVGSGLAGMAAAEALAERGVRPVVLDVGRDLDPQRAAWVARLAARAPDTWSDDDRAVFAVPRVGAGGGKPRKLAFGSPHFYGEPGRDLPIVADGPAPPFSHARGGLSAGWGASVLLPHDDDLESWPIRRAALASHAARALRGLPYSARADGLQRHFPILHDAPAALPPTPATQGLLADLARGLGDGDGVDDVTFGQSRLLTRVDDGEDGAPGCRACGECMSGCAYGAIHQASHTLQRLQARGAVEYEPGVRVDVLREVEGGVRVDLARATGAMEARTFDRVFLAAGAVGSTVIMLRSLGCFDRPVRLLSTGGFVVPLWRRRAPPSGWPSLNTQAGVFLAFRARALSPHWVHTQLSTFNELALSLIGARATRPGLWTRVKRRLLEHLVVAHANFHSDHANAFVVSLAPDARTLRTALEDRPAVRVAHRVYLRRLEGLLRRCRTHAIPFSAQHGVRGESFHVGGSLPMRAAPTEATETDLWGRPRGWRRVHVVDSSTFPSLPGTTIGLLAMANAWRIASEVALDA